MSPSLFLPPHTSQCKIKYGRDGGLGLSDSIGKISHQITIIVIMSLFTSKVEKTSVIGQMRSTKTEKPSLPKI